ncbi:MAG TPA: DNA polymerase III subunit gamma/tau [Candidatus Moranbacteria bacterium]|nr:DNA polymerase III subunit gamma/tau [Candidatus Moranbacteria bacterium]
MSSTLYRKYRPKNFSEIIGQKHIVQTLSNAIKNNRVAHAYLFTGSRGTGKTSIARILAKTINCTDQKNSISCEKCSNCKVINDARSLDIIEIDAASNTGVDNIRELKETINLPPTQLKHKVYIIDEVHMLSTGAFNALLKTLEEPPAHVVFILATTEIHKVPATIVSRCQKFDFAKLPLENIIEKLSGIAKKEKITIDAESLEMIAIAAEGGMRDAESLLGQVISLEDKNITIKEVEEILGTTDRKFSAEIADLIIKKDVTKAISRINNIVTDGYDLQIFAKSLTNYLRQLMLLKINPELKTSFVYESTEEQIKKMLEQSKGIELCEIILALNLFLEAQGKIASAVLPQLPLEIALIRATHTFPANSTEYTQQETTGQINMVQNETSSPNMLQSTPDAQPKISEIMEEEPVIKNLDPTLPEGDTDLYTVRNSWRKLLEEIKNHNHSLAALLASNCQPISVSGNEITVATPYDFYKEKLNDHDNKLTVESVFGKILGLQIRLKIVTHKEAGIVIEAPKEEIKNDAPGEQNSLINSALDIMGAKVVEE